MTPDQLREARRAAFIRQPFHTLLTGSSVTTDAHGVPDGVASSPKGAVVDQLVDRFINDLMGCDGPGDAVALIREWTTLCGNDMAAVSSVTINALVRLLVDEPEFPSAVRAEFRRQSAALWDSDIELS
ncbi:hypothetical protein SEA_VANLEE_108 [Gordonia phage VanLee]|uniref:Uncharacterized protein n=1 Tax=Gordonia phage VanLee TaxID=2845816 RepID=A0A8F2DA76_9CAUD|nr:hypothetical protein QEH49_gp108 [Gordonia phage VanLee]QWS68225.1 hypothetical protein SEA_VANLEE_108 [Gordonia phage VanLee]